LRVFIIFCGYPGDVCGFRNQSQTTTNANSRVARGLASFKASFAPAYAA